MDIEIKRGSDISYSSTQFDLGREDRNLIQEFINTTIDKDDLHGYGIEKSSHITIKYGLHDQLPVNLRRVLQQSGISSVTIMLGRTSIFESEEYDVLKIDVTSGELRKLNKLLSKNLEVTDTFPVYKPHLTLCYCLKGTGQKYTGDKTFEGKIITFDRVTFSPVEMEDTFLYLYEKEVELDEPK